MILSNIVLVLGIDLKKSGENKKEKEKKSKSYKKDKSRLCHESEGKTHGNEKHSPTKLIKQKFMTLGHSAKKLHPKSSELKV